MKLRQFLKENAEVLKDKVVSWSFDSYQYELRVLGPFVMEYRSGGIGWTKTDIAGLRDFNLISFTVGPRQLLFHPKLTLVTTG